jgi:hypothetical protein
MRKSTAFPTTTGAGEAKTTTFRPGSSSSIFHLFLTISRIWRISYAGFTISRYPTKIARYKMVKHTKEQLNPVNELAFSCIPVLNLPSASSAVGTPS